MMNPDKIFPPLDCFAYTCADYDDTLDTVIENIKEQERDIPSPLIQSAAVDVLADFTRELQTHACAMNDFQSTRLEYWDLKIIDPLVKLTERRIEQKEREDSRQRMEKLQEKINLLLIYKEKLESTQEENCDSDSDNDSLHLEG